MSHARRKLTAVLSIALGIAAPVGVLIATASARDLQKVRHDHYHELGDAFKTVREPDARRHARPGEDQGGRTGDQRSVDRPGPLVPRRHRAEAGKTRALPEIWTRPDDFKAAQKVFSDAAPKLLAAANGGDLNAVKSTYGDLGKACKNCHDTFRAPEDHDH